jgi:RNA polymerase sigma-70 factor (ECF subfamily)
MDKLTEQENNIVKELLQGKSGAAREFYKFYHQQLKTYVLYKTKCAEDAEEIVQDTFMSAIDSLELFSGRSKLITWLYAIARHEISDYYRKKRVKTLVMSHVPILGEILEDKQWRNQYDLFALREQIKVVLNRMKPRYALVLKMKYIEGWSVKDMARELNESFKATETALFRARKAFAFEWNNMYGEE